MLQGCMYEGGRLNPMFKVMVLLAHYPDLHLPLPQRVAGPLP